LTFASARLKRGTKAPGERLPALTPVPDGAEFGKNLASQSRQFAASANRRFQFEKRSQLFIRGRNKTLSVVAMCVCNPDRSLVGINR
jgi:hypothetical protein